MANNRKIELLLEAESRGILPPEKQELLDEARRRGLVAPKEQVEQPVAPEETTQPDFLSTTIRSGLQGTGLVGGGLFGSRAGPLGAVAGAALGYGAGENIADIVDALRGVGQPKTVGQQLMELPGELATGATLEMGGQVGGRLLAKGAQRLVAPFAKTVEQETVQAEKALRKASGIGFSPAQKTDSYLVDVIEDASEHGIFGGGPFKKFRIKQQTGVDKYISETTDAIASNVHGKLSAEEVGNLVGEVIGGKNRAFRKAAESLYGRVDDLTVGHTVDLHLLKNFANDVMETAAKRKGIGSTQAGDTLLKRVLNLDDRISFREAQSLRSALLDEKSAMSTTKDKAVGLAKKFISLTDTSMETAANQRLSPEAKALWRNANKFYRYGKERYDNEFLRKMTRAIKDRPEVVVDTIFKNNAVTPIRKVRNAVDKETFQALKHAYLEKIMNKSTTPGEGMFTGKTFLSQLKQMGNPALGEMFTAQELQSIRNVGVVAHTIQKPIGGRVGMLVQLMQGSAVAGLFFGRAEGTPILIGPYAMSRIMTNPTWSKWFAEGFRSPIGSTKATELAVKLSGIALMLEKERQDQSEIQPSPELGAL